MDKIIFDGALFSECEMVGNNRYGMLRIAEEICARIIGNQNFDISFANTIYQEKYHFSLIKYVNNNYPHLGNNILSKKPSAIFNVLKFRNIYRKMPWLLFLDVKNESFENYKLFHSFYYPFPSNVAQKSIKKSITLLDIIPLKMNGYTKATRNLTQNIVNSIENNYAISISEFSKQDLLNYNKKINASNVFVAPLAAAKHIFYKNDNEQDWQSVKEKYNLPNQYFLCISSSDIRKNISHLVLSFSKFILQEKKNDIYLVLAGNSTHSYELLNQLNIDNEVRKQIVFTTRFIEEIDLAVVYSKALCFFFMSLYEGFGLPVLEAMQCGTPTVSANCTSLPEIVGDAGILISPTDQDLLCQTMLDIYENSSLRQNLTNLGLQRASEFSWDRAAKEYSEIFSKIINQ